MLFLAIQYRFVYPFLQPFRPFQSFLSTLAAITLALSRDTSSSHSLCILRRKASSIVFAIALEPFEPL